MTQFHLAQINAAKARFPVEDPRMADFMVALDEINAIADNDPDFVWRLQDDSGNSTGVRVDGEPDVLINMSVWRSIDALKRYVYKSAHAAFLKRRKEWFQRESEPVLALWWVPEGHIPTVEEGYERLRQLRAKGPGPEAFSFNQNFPPPGSET